MWGTGRKNVACNAFDTDCPAQRVCWWSCLSARRTDVFFKC